MRCIICKQFSPFCSLLFCQMMVSFAVHRFFSFTRFYFVNLPACVLISCSESPFQDNEFKLILLFSLGIWSCVDILYPFGGFCRSIFVPVYATVLFVKHHLLEILSFVHFVFLTSFLATYAWIFSSVPLINMSGFVWTPCCLLAWFHNIS